MIYYRGARSSAFDKGVFDGIWVSKDPKNAAQYGRVWMYQTLRKLKLLTFNTDRSCKKFGKWYCYLWPEEEELVHQADDYAELFMFPPKHFTFFLKDRGWDGYNFGNTTFIVEPQKKLKFMGAAK